MKKLFSLALLLCAAVQGTWAQPSLGGGDGSAKNPYLISTSAHWDELSKEIAKGFNTIGMYFQLNADITVTTMLGTDGNHEFSGTFDGNGKTLTFNCGSESDPFGETYCAPFRYINKANFSNFTVDGTIFTNNQFAAGFVGHAIGYNSFDNCVSNISINSSVEGDGIHGGFVADIQGGSTTITDCAFTGSLNGSDTHSWGGFVGWTESDQPASASVSFNNCVFYPSSQNVNTSGSATFSRGHENHTTNISLVDCFYITALGDIQGSVQGYPDDDSPSAALAEKTIAGTSFFIEIEYECQPTASNITATSATISWNSMKGFTYQLRYRVSTYTNSFEDDEDLENWNTIDADGDGDCWYLSDQMARTGERCLYSKSYENAQGPLDPDNWLISPQLDLGSALKVWVGSPTDDRPSENFAIYLSTTGQNVDDFTTVLLPATRTTFGYQPYTADLSKFTGQKGYIGIRHFESADHFKILVDDFTIFSGDGWMTIDNATSGTTITGLAPNTVCDYQVVYTIGGETYTSPIGTLTTLDDKNAPFDINVTNITSNTATIGWYGYADNYNLRYRSYIGNSAKVTLNVPSSIWTDNTGYQMLLDADHNTYGTVFPESGPLTDSGDASAETYNEFEYKIPENADGALTTTNDIIQGSITIEIPAGIYDWCITNPTPGDYVWIASSNGNIGGRADDFMFEPGKHYTFTVTAEGLGDRVDLTVGVIDEDEFTTVNGISNTSYTLSDLEPNTYYLVQVQSDKDDQPSEWVLTSFTTLEEGSVGNINLLDNADNSEVIAANAGQECNVTLKGRTLYKDGSWNTLCLPFDVEDSNTTDGISFTGTPLEGATVKTLGNSEGCNTGFDEASGTLYLDFVDAEKIEAGHAYIVKWAETTDPDYIKNPVFTGVTIENENPADQSVLSSDGFVTFVGSYNPVVIDEEGDNTVLYLGADNTLYYPSGAMTIGAQRAYFQLNGLTAGDPTSTEPGQSIKAFHLNFGEEETGIHMMEDVRGKMEEAWFSIDGYRLIAKPTTKGLYIHNGVKVLIK